MLKYRQINQRKICSPPNPLAQKGIDLRKGLGAKEAAVGAKRRWMGALNDEVTIRSYELFLALGMLAPKYKYHGGCL